ncbi:hypothetical protein INR49_008964 [Caranx melampygus]|nr:hypothetical protein INR49_008964 [Caranx melampygus]
MFLCSACRLVSFCPPQLHSSENVVCVGGAKQKSDQREMRNTLERESLFFPASGLEGREDGLFSAVNQFLFCEGTHLYLSRLLCFHQKAQQRGQRREEDVIPAAFDDLDNNISPNLKNIHNTFYCCQLRQVVISIWYICNKAGRREKSVRQVRVCVSSQSDQSRGEREREKLTTRTSCR